MISDDNLPFAPTIEQGVSSGLWSVPHLVTFLPRRSINEKIMHVKLDAARDIAGESGRFRSDVLLNWQTVVSFAPDREATVSIPSRSLNQELIRAAMLH